MTREIVINEYGHQQVVNDLGEYLCATCGSPYTNTGEGVICEHCDDELDED
mgnify:FL=1